MHLPEKVRKHLTEEKTDEVINTLTQIFTVADLKTDDIQKAIQLGFRDFEDALQSVAVQSKGGFSHHPKPEGLHVIKGF
ncbi:MAG: hypothetical protein AAGU27_12750 [Dehalobacterium sp.]